VRRGIREQQFNSKYNPPPSLVARNFTYGVTERVDCEGASWRRSIVRGARGDRELKRQGVESMAVSLLFSFLNPKHEQEIAALLKSDFPVPTFPFRPGAPQLRAYERRARPRSTRPDRSWRAIWIADGTFTRAGFIAQLWIMQSNGGVMAPETAARFACRTLPGPAGGPVAAIFCGQRAGYKDLIAMDMGGTSFDVSFIKNGAVSFTTEAKSAAMPAFPVLMCGGRRRRQHRLGRRRRRAACRSCQRRRRSRPICYGRGGKEPTVTDADLLLGYIGADDFLAAV
jgi:N-methylhydantoinase A